MQKKVSKSNLLVLLLSILIGISLTMTITFANFTTSKTVTGTLTFESNNLAIALEGWSAGSEGVQKTLALNNSHFEVVDTAKGTIRINDAGVNAIKALKYKVTGIPKNCKAKVTFTFEKVGDDTTGIAAINPYVTLGKAGTVASTDNMSQSAVVFPTCAKTNDGATAAGIGKGIKFTLTIHAEIIANANA